MRAKTICWLALAGLLANASAWADSPWGAPIVQLGRPEPLPEGDAIAPVSATLGVPCPIGQPGQQRVVRGQSPDAPPAPPPLPPPASIPVAPGALPPPPPAPPGAGGGVPMLAPIDKEEAYNCGVVTRETRAGGFFGRAWDNTKEFVGGVPGEVMGILQPGPNRKLFQTDHRFDAFAAPVSFPFYAEPPQATTEAKLLFRYERTLPVGPAVATFNNYFGGGQFRVAVTDWLSVVVNRVGGIWTQPVGGGPTVGTFSELWLGPKFTLIKNENSGSLLATGLTFQIPTGSLVLAQNTGRLSLAPYLSVAQKFFPDFKYGSIILWNTTGYAFRTDGVRSEYLYNVFHLNWDILNLHMFYPEVGLQWNLYTRNGTSPGFPAGTAFEGIDWANFGAPNAGRNDLSISTGLRWKINEHLQTGFAFQWGLIRTIPNHWENWAATVDLRIIY